MLFVTIYPKNGSSSHREHREHREHRGHREHRESSGFVCFFASPNRWMRYSRQRIVFPLCSLWLNAFSRITCYSRTAVIRSNNASLRASIFPSATASRSTQPGSCWCRQSRKRHWPRYFANSTKPCSILPKLRWCRPNACTPGQSIKLLVSSRRYSRAWEIGRAHV